MQHFVIAKNQGGFMQNKQIIDNIILVRGAVHSSKERKERGMLIKINMANAFDIVRFPFLTL